MKRLVFLVLFLCSIFVVNVAVSASEEVSNSIFLEEIEDMNKSIKVIMELNYSITEPEIDSNSYFLEDLKEIRARNKEYHTEKNENFIEENNLSDFGLTMSSYSPFLFKTYETYTDYQNEKQIYLSLLDTSNSVSTIYISNENFENEDAYVDEENCYQDITLEEAKEMIQIYDSNYTGKNVKIGIIDAGIPYDINFPKGYHKLNSDLEESTHTTLVATILGGKYGIAPDAELYFGSKNSVTQSMEWMLGEGVNVVNCSFGYDYKNGIYLGYSAYFDYIIRWNYISIIKSSGNKSDSKLITNPGLGLNVLTVGAVNKSLAVSHLSSYEVQEPYKDIILKPNVVAPGENIVIPNVIGSSSGTSLAAPMVTGMLAVLMEEFAILTIRPNLCITAIMSGASWLPGQTEVIDKAAGAGLINYETTRSLLKTNKYDIETAYWGTPIDTMVMVSGIIVPAHSQADLFFMSLSDSSVTNYSSNEVPLKFTNYKIKVYDDIDDLISEEILQSNIKGYHFVNDTDYDMRYNFVIFLASDMVSYNTELLVTSHRIY